METHDSPALARRGYPDGPAGQVIASAAIPARGATLTLTTRKPTVGPARCHGVLGGVWRDLGGGLDQDPMGVGGMPKSAFFGTPPRSQDTPPWVSDPPSYYWENRQAFWSLFGHFFDQKMAIFLVGFPSCYIIYRPPPRVLFGHPPRSWEAGFGIPPQVPESRFWHTPPGPKKPVFGIPPLGPGKPVLAWGGRQKQAFLATPPRGRGVGQKPPFLAFGHPPRQTRKRGVFWPNPTA